MTNVNYHATIFIAHSLRQENRLFIRRIYIVDLPEIIFL